MNGFVKCDLVMRENIVCFEISISVKGFRYKRLNNVCLCIFEVFRIYLFILIEN